MCDFKPGDEVVVVRSDYGREGMICTVLAVCRAGEVPPILRGDLSGAWLAPLSGETGVIQVEEVEWNERVTETGWVWGYDETCFRKVQRRDLQSWLQTSVPNTDHLDKPLPAKKRERV